MTADHLLYAKLGFEPIRYFDELVRPLDPLPELVPLSGITSLRGPLSATRRFAM